MKIRKTELIIIHPSATMTQTKTGSLFYLFSLSNMLVLIRCTSIHSSSLLYFDGQGSSYTENERNLFLSKKMLNIFLFNKCFEKRNIFRKPVKNCFGGALDNF